MKKYKYIRRSIKDGDVLLVEGQGIISRLIRVLTGQQISHVALLLWIDNGLWVAEMKEFKGYRLMPASIWIRDNSENVIYHGIAPYPVRANNDLLKKAISYRAEKYGYLSLLKIWWAQITRKKINVKKLVCSTFVQHCWMVAGYKFEQTADPGDYMRLCDSTQVISL